MATAPWTEKESHINTTFTWTEVENSYPNIDAPTHIWTFRDPNNKPIFDDDRQPVALMVRQEYHDALLAILQWMAADELKRNTIPFTPTNTLLTNPGQYPNPFLTNKAFGRERLIIAGLPGIGKTTFLRYLWVLRIAANLPTLFCELGPTYLWKDKKLYTANFKLNDFESEYFTDHVPRATWFLFDSNNILIDIPASVYDLNYFIMQAASPRQRRLEWAQKAGASFFFMREWSPGELIAGLQVQVRPKSGATVEQLVSFHEKLGSSARDAYVNGSKLDSMISTLRSNTLKLNFDYLIEAHTVHASSGSAPQLPSVDLQISHFFASVYPSTNADRMEYEVRPASEFIMEMVWKAIVKREQGNQFEVFSRLMQSSDISAKMVAAYLFDTQYHHYLCSGRDLPCHRMKPRNEPSADQTMRTWSSPSDESTPHTFSIPSNIPTIRFRTNDVFKFQENTYYIPWAKNFATFDSIWVRADGHVVLIQGTVSSRHSVSKEGLWWLWDRGVRSIEYIYLSPVAVNSVSIRLPVSIPPDLIYPNPVQHIATLIPSTMSPARSSSVSSTSSLFRPKRLSKKMKMKMKNTEGEENVGGDGNTSRDEDEDLSGEQTPTAASSRASGRGRGKGKGKGRGGGRGRGSGSGRVDTTRGTSRTRGGSQAGKSRKGKEKAHDMGEEVALRVTPEVDSLVTPEVEPAVTPEVPESEPDVEVKSTHRQGFPPIQFLGVYHVLMDLEFSTQSKQTKRRYRE